MHILQAFFRIARIFRQSTPCCETATDGENGSSDFFGEQHVDVDVSDHRRAQLSESARLLPRQRSKRQPHRRSSSWWRKSESTPSLTSEFMTYSRSFHAFGLFAAHAALYYVLAVLGYHFWLEHMSLVDSLYFATSLFTTIGYGDVVPTSPGGLVFTLFLATYGIILLGIAIGIFGEWIVDLNTRNRETQRKVMATNFLNSIEEEGPRQEHDGAASDTWDDSSINCEVDSDLTLLSSVLRIIILELPIVAILVLVALGIGRAEGWSVLESVYWLANSGFTIGTGDFVPDTTATKLVCVFFLPLCVAVLGEILARIAALYMRRKDRQAERQFLTQTMTLCDLRKLDADQNGRVDRAEFLTYMLVALQKVPREDIEEILVAFQRLDKDGNGYLTEADLGVVPRAFRRSVARFPASIILEEDSDEEQLFAGKSSYVDFIEQGN